MKKPKNYIRPSDKEIFSLNKDGTYSSEYMKKHFPNSLHQKHSADILKKLRFIAIYEVKN